MSGFSGIDPQALEEMRAQRDCLLIDVRTDEEVGRGMIAGARHIPLHQLASRIDTIGRDRSVVFYCQSGARSMQASAFLAARGWPEVYNLNGGIVAWVRSGLPVAMPQ